MSGIEFSSSQGLGHDHCAVGALPVLTARVARIPEGFALVPIKPTEAMISAGRSALYRRRYGRLLDTFQGGASKSLADDPEQISTDALEVLAAMIAAAPKPVTDDGHSFERA